MPARYITVPATTTADINMWGQRITLLGWSLMEDAGTPAVATVVIRDGTSAAAPIAAVIKMPASGNAQQWFGDIDNGGIVLGNGLYFDMITGSMSGAIYIA